MYYYYYVVIVIIPIRLRSNLIRVRNSKVSIREGVYYNIINYIITKCLVIKENVLLIVSTKNSSFLY